MNKEFTRSRKDRMISGVCGGLAELLGIPSWLIRVIIVLMALSGGLMPVSYTHLPSLFCAR